MEKEAQPVLILESKQKAVQEETIPPHTSKKRLIAFFIMCTIVLSIFFAYRHFLGASSYKGKMEHFIVPLSGSTETALEKLVSEGFVKDRKTFEYIFHMRGGFEIVPGGYEISKTMNVWQLTNVFLNSKRMKWVVIPEGLRKEEIAVILGKELDWKEEEITKWITIDTAEDPEYQEGVYFPDTYLIGTEESPAKVALRLRAQFEEKFAPYAEEAARQNIKWDTVLKIASLVQRESAGKDDMALIAGIIWNRLLDEKRLDIDATLQYARGDTGKGWWAPITSEEKNAVIDSPFNTYSHGGLPPQPICNPGTDAISAALYPEKTSCMYYLHDNSRIIHCTETYDEHRANIERYLR